jgi:transposase
MEAYSQDLRKRIVQAVKTTGNQTQVAITFQVSRSTVRRYLKLEEHDSELTPKKRPGRHSDIPVENHSRVTAFVETKNDLTLDELAQLYYQHYHLKLHKSTFCRLLGRLGWTRKKRVWQPPSVMNKPGLRSEQTRPL